MTDSTTPTPTDTPLKKMSDLSFAERGKLFFRKYQYINGQHLPDVEAEEKARADFHVVPMTDSEKEKAAGPGIVRRVVDNRVMQTVGASAVIHKTWDTYIEGKDAKKETATATPAAAPDASTPAMTQDVPSADGEEAPPPVAAATPAPSSDHPFESENAAADTSLGDKLKTGVHDQAHKLEDAAKSKAQHLAQSVVTGLAARVGLRVSEEEKAPSSEKKTDA